ncbi:helix-turn-helix transcriptional regulator [Kaistia defluvii]|uniref:helix-turn-helix domain-containing protein n=1 Tax=Kaistia defluvii TaxID=410841 RepID=UPI002253DDEC|nr:helix-turn-helix transcriptional regulator [Kaistia defluvii]MCX5519889.1 helix-turn-helix transcriptional regulator [Kaistia defluvii]
MATNPRPIGEQIRDWRQRRRRSQMDLAGDAEMSTRHLSFIETGRSRPSRDMVLRLAAELEVPLREQNRMLVAAGFAPVYQERRLDDAGLTVVRKAVERIIVGHEPYPALAIDRQWNLVVANAAIMRLVASVDASLLEPPVNVLRLALHPKGLAPRTLNLPEWRAHLLARLAHEIDLTGDAGLADLLEELRAYPSGGAGRPVVRDDLGGIAVPYRVRLGDETLSFISATTLFGTPVDVTLSELAIESFFPADDDTAEALRRLAVAS